MENNKITAIIPTGVKLTGVELSPEFMEYKQEFDSLQRKFCALFGGWVLAGKVKSIDNKYVKFNEEMWDGKFGRKEQHPKDEASLRHIKALPEIKSLLASELPKEKLDNLLGAAVDDMLWYVVERFKSFVKRNSTKSKKKFPKNGITLKQNKAMNFKDGKIKVNAKEKTFTIKTIQKKQEITLPFKDSYYNNLDLVDGEWRGGNIVFNSLEMNADNELVLRVEEEREMSFPKIMIGVDVNKAKENWFTISEAMENGKVTMPKPNNIASLESKRDEMNAKVRPSNKKKEEPEYRLNSAQNRIMYRRIHKIMANRHTAIEEAVVPVLNYFFEKYGDDLGVAIDGVATGARGGNSFGQDDVRDVVWRWCVKTNVPFIIVPPNYTSQKCPECGHIHKQDRKKNMNAFMCPSCGYFNESCDHVGALNIRDHGKFLLEKFKLTSTSLSTNVDKTPLAKTFKNALYEEFNFPQFKRIPHL